MNTEVFSWGNDANGQLGLGNVHGQGGEAMEKGAGRDSYKQPQPRFCIYGITIKMVSCGAEHSAFVTDLNFVYSIGSNRCGQLGIRDTEVKNKCSPVLVEQLQGFKIIDISCGSNHTVCVTDRGEAYSWGEGRYGALGIMDVETDQFRPQKVIFQDNASNAKKVVHVVNVSAGEKHTTFLDSNGNVFATGNNE